MMQQQSFACLDDITDLSVCCCCRDRCQEKRRCTFHYKFQRKPTSNGLVYAWCASHCYFCCTQYDRSCGTLLTIIEYKKQFIIALSIKMYCIFYTDYVNVWFVLFRILSELGAPFTEFQLNTKFVGVFDYWILYAIFQLNLSLQFKCSLKTIRLLFFCLSVVVLTNRHSSFHAK